MSWDDHVCAGIRNSSHTRCAVICGKDGTIWGKHGINKITANELAALCSATGNSSAACLEGIKFHFINNVDGCAGYRAGKISAAAYSANSHTGVVIGCEGVCVQDCMDLAIKLRNYMKSIGQE